MKINSKDSQLQIFVSSRCSNLDSNLDEINQYNIIRRAIKSILENTGLFNVYIFEEAMASSSTSSDSYLNKIDRSDIILFLIDSRDGMVTDAVMKEHNRAKETKKPRLYIIYENGKVTSIQKELQGPDGVRYKSTDKLSEIVDLAVESVICEVLENYAMTNNRVVMEKMAASTEENLNKLEKLVNDNLFLDKNSYGKVERIFSELSKNRKSSITDEDNTQWNQYDLLYTDYFLYKNNKKRVLDLNWKQLVRGDLFEEQFRPYLEKRSKAFCAYHEGEYESAYEILLNLHEDLKETSIPSWYKKDILIDLRHLESKNNMPLNIFYQLEGVQKMITDNKYPLYYPMVDRYRENSFQTILKEKNKDKLKSEFSVTYGNSLEYVLTNFISKQFITAMSYCSIVHVEMVFNDLSEIFLHYYFQTGYYYYGELALDFSIISGKLDVFSKIITEQSNLLKSCSFEKIYSYFDLLQENHKDWRELLRARLFSDLGKFMDDQRFEELFEENIDLLIRELSTEKTQTFKVESILKGIKNNVSRYKNGEKITIAFDCALEKKSTRFYESFIEIYQKILFVNSNYFDLDFIHSFLEKIKQSFENGYGSNKEFINNFLLDFSLKVEGSAEIIEKFLIEYSKEFYEINFLRSHDLVQKKNNLIWITESIKKINRSIDNQQSSPGVFGYGGNLFEDLITTVIDVNESLGIKDLEMVINCIEELLKASSIQINSKDEALDSLFFLLMNEKNEEKYNYILQRTKVLINSENLKQVKNRTFDAPTLETSYYSYLVNLEMLYCFLNNTEECSFLLTLNSKTYLEKIHATRFMKIILHCYTMNKVEVNNNLLLLIKFIAFNFIEEESDRLRGNSAEILFLLHSIDFKNEAMYYQRILTLSQDNNQNVRATIASIIMNNSDYRKKFEGIKNSLSQDNYYFVRSLVLDK
ncbi:MAG: DUF4062 domain-containing protein [Vagococcus sp.]|uniref:DUF4062 domain-containing protein n=1 Tax=Vagococcus TaxID=2737 RepID=UPI002FC73694